MDREEVLTGGNVAGRVVRIGSTVRKPAGVQTAGVEAVLEHLAGFDGAPRTLGRDEQGRHVLEYVPGVLADTLGPLPVEDLRRIARLIRELHDAMDSFQPPPHATWTPAVPDPAVLRDPAVRGPGVPDSALPDSGVRGPAAPDPAVRVPAVPDPAGGALICHGDLAPWNLVRSGGRWVFIDWDNAGPSTRLWDLAYAAQAFVPLIPSGDVAADAARLRSFADAYGLDHEQRLAFPAQIAARTRGSYELLVRGHETGEQPWAGLYAEGHADFWGPAAAYTAEHQDAWLKALTA